MKRENKANKIFNYLKLNGFIVNDEDLKNFEEILNIRKKGENKQE